VLDRIVLDKGIKTEIVRGKVNRLKYLIYVENIDVLSGFVLILL
jgi:hypothetical protein